MTVRQVLMAATALGLASAPVRAQQPAAAGHAEGMMAMVCTMGMFPHPGMGEGMMGGQGMGGMMQPGAAGSGMQPGAMMGGMQHGAMGGMKQDSAGKAGAAAQPGAMGGMQHGATGGMQHGAAGGMQHGAAAPAAGSMGGMEHPVTPAMLIDHAQDLGLTSEQQAKVTQLAQTSQASCEQHMQAAEASHKAAAAVLDGAHPDVAAYQSKLREVADHIIEAHVAVVKAGLEASAVLTPAQREKLAATARSMHGKQ